jgi:hypothetical protein
VFKEKVKLPLKVKVKDNFTFLMQFMLELTGNTPVGLNGLLQR